MFQPDAPWRDAASHVKVFKLYADFVLQSSQEQINTVISDLNRRGIAIALESGVINTAYDPVTRCGGPGNPDGYQTAQAAGDISRKIKAAHGELKYIAMGEPFFYGHFYTQRPGMGCHRAVHDLMALAKPTLSVYAQEFPGVMFGDIEPTGYVDGEPTWQVDLQEWAEEFRAVMEKPLAFMQIDVQWVNPDGETNAVAFYKFAQQLQKQGLVGKLGIVYEGSAKEKSDKAWTKAARDHVLIMEERHELQPDQAIFQSWQSNPTHSMPDSKKDTLTSLVNYYFTPDVKALRGEK
jgi:hypothetical protein